MTSKAGLDCSLCWTLRVPRSRECTGTTALEWKRNAVVAHLSMRNHVQSVNGGGEGRYFGKVAFSATLNFYKGGVRKVRLGWVELDGDEGRRAVDRTDFFFSW